MDGDRLDRPLVCVFKGRSNLFGEKCWDYNFIPVCQRRRQRVDHPREKTTAMSPSPWPSWQINNSSLLMLT